MGYPLENEPARWEQARAGDPEAFATLFDAHRDRIFGQALRLIKSPHDAEDITALVFLEAWRRRSVVRLVDGSIIAWLLVTTNYVAKNSARTFRRHRAAMTSLPPVEQIPDFSADVDERLDAEARPVSLRAALTRLSRNHQNVITLCIIEELTIQQASEVLGISPGTVKSRLSRAKHKLAHLMSEFTTSGSALGGAL